MVDQENKEHAFAHDTEKVITIVYTNWRGETAARHIVPVSLHWGKTDWHPHHQWLMKVWDVEKKAYRDYAVKDIQSWDVKTK